MQGLAPALEARVCRHVTDVRYDVPTTLSNRLVLRLGLTRSTMVISSRHECCIWSALPIYRVRQEIGAPHSLDTPPDAAASSGNATKLSSPLNFLSGLVVSNVWLAERARPRSKVNRDMVLNGGYSQVPTRRHTP